MLDSDLNPLRTWNLVHVSVLQKLYVSLLGARKIVPGLSTLDPGVTPVRSQGALITSGSNCSAARNYCPLIISQVRLTRDHCLSLIYLRSDYVAFSRGFEVLQLC